MVLLLYNLSEVNGIYIRVPFSFQLQNENDSETLRLFISVYFCSREWQPSISQILIFKTCSSASVGLIHLIFVGLGPFRGWRGEF